MLRYSIAEYRDVLYQQIQAKKKEQRRAAKAKRERRRAKKEAEADDGAKVSLHQVQSQDED